MSTVYKDDWAILKAFEAYGQFPLQKGHSSLPLQSSGMEAVLLGPSRPWASKGWDSESTAHYASSPQIASRIRFLVPI